MPNPNPLETQISLQTILELNQATDELYKYLTKIMSYSPSSSMLIKFSI